MTPFKFALAVSVAVHLVAFAAVQATVTSVGKPVEKESTLTVMILVPATDDEVPKEKEVPPEVATPPAAEPVVKPPEPAPLLISTPVPVVPPEEPKPMVIETTTSEPHVPSDVPAQAIPPATVFIPVTNAVVAMAVSPERSPSAVAIAKASPPPILTTGRVKYRRAPDPDYPSLARRRRQEGTVLLDVTIAPSGRPMAVAVKKSSTFPLLDRAAVDAVQFWEFEVNVDTSIRAEVPVRFQLVQ